jgi:hypothetical protein
MAEELSVVELARVSVTEASTLLGMVSEFKPQTRQVALPVELVQDSVLLAEPVAGASVADVKSVVE